MRPHTIRRVETVIALAAVIALVIFAGAVFNHSLAFGEAGPTHQIGQPQVQVVKPCTVPAGIYNANVRKLNALKGKKVRRGVHKRIACSKYRALKKRLLKARADCLRQAQRTEASVYWPGADSGGMTGSCGHHLSQFKYAYAELGMGTYLGGLRCGQTLYMHGPNGRTVAVPKVDIGYGSGSRGRGIDLWNRTGPAIGIGNGIGQVTVSTRNCWAK
jgi:hypothetical protein